ncbi:hypothetical protein IU500_18505 [Nocardia terpenica]|uniref:alpha/beta fold hydrolase n=1 Tax=Nocardia terpenica TaxID=455432 RepID=UPI001894B39A|nr:alpha/beta hydrolase [Nocardia terpenica]MBF6063478.1 hypothetical protein [Nocardia terpenica]MBF6106034.1 hypothetical protein [Nocardia terpenica]MBF6113381.1 hypothetical protein [Nocardia terpenica]MBF6119775.1 hypothetical protein [Nocardia terpenica]MBF6152186.1 hypothetical protein [Nocardia terpenica]
MTVERWGAATAPATIVYVGALHSDSSLWAPVITHLHGLLAGGIAQLTYTSRDRVGGVAPSSVATQMSHRVEELDTALTCAVGAVVLVTHSTGSLLAHAYAHRHPYRAAALAGLVLINGVTDRSWPASPATPVLRGVPAFVLAGGEDSRFSRAHSHRLAELVWADYDLVPGGGHCLPRSAPEQTAAPILAALDLAYRTEITGSSDSGDRP